MSNRKPPPNKPPVVKLGSCASIFNTAPMVYSQKPELIESRIRPEWKPSLFTDPNQHSNQRFIYIVRRGDLAQTRSNVVSASVISQDFTGVYYNYSWVYILRVPEANILASSRKDTGKPTTSGDGNDFSEYIASRWAEALGLHTPQELIRDSLEWASSKMNDKRRDPNLIYNEILFYPTLHRNGVSTNASITGVIFFQGRQGWAESPNESERELYVEPRL